MSALPLTPPRLQQSMVTCVRGGWEMVAVVATVVPLTFCALIALAVLVSSTSLSRRNTTKSASSVLLSHPAAAANGASGAAGDEGVIAADANERVPSNTTERVTRAVASANSSAPALDTGADELSS
ncbi:hypothetical protein V5799_020419 [Amblyomma americanum]|uniref:Uncharacterized protein n=1 Tax=Amblyomma americanum TaxID=6943 RepID=A0AAQ4EU42_AMBAM